MKAKRAELCKLSSLSYALLPKLISCSDSGKKMPQPCEQEFQYPEPGPSTSTRPSEEKRQSTSQGSTENSRFKT